MTSRLKVRGAWVLAGLLLAIVGCTDRDDDDDGPECEFSDDCPATRPYCDSEEGACTCREWRNDCREGTSCQRDPDTDDLSCQPTDEEPAPPDAMSTPDASPIQPDAAAQPDVPAPPDVPASEPDVAPQPDLPVAPPDASAGPDVAAADTTGAACSSNQPCNAGKGCRASVCVDPPANQARTTVNGTVRDASDQPVSDVVIVATWTVDGASYEARTTTQAGSYALNNMPVGVSVTLTPSKAGLLVGSKTVVPVANPLGDPQLNRCDFKPNALRTLTAVQVTPAGASVAVAQTQMYTATAFYSDGTTADVTTAATWTSSSPTVASVGASSGLATGLAAGTTVITASVTELGVTKSGTSVLVVTDTRLANLTVTPGTAMVTPGGTQQFQATATLGNGTMMVLTSGVTWIASAGATIGTTGLATATAVGDVTITASYTAAGITKTGTATLLVRNATVTSVAVTGGGSPVAAGLTTQLVATATLSDSTTANVTTGATWQSSNTAIATVSSGGLVTAVAAGTATISASYGGALGTKDVTATAEVLNSVTVMASAASVANGLGVTLTATGNYTTGARDVTSSATFASQPGVFTIAGNVATANSAGPYPVTGALTATLAGVTSPAVNVSITAPVLLSIAITPASPTVGVGTTRPLWATGTYSSGAPADITQLVTWASSDTGKATISNTGTRGVLTGVQTGSSMITASLGGVTSAPISASVIVDTLLSIAVTPSSSFLLIGATGTLTAVGTYASGATADVSATASWSASTSDLTVTSGVMTGVTTGWAQVGASIGNVSSPQVTIDVAPEPVVSIAITPAPTRSTNVGIFVIFSAVVTYQSGATATLSNKMHWLSSATNVGTIAYYGGFNPLSAGMTNITATFAGVTSPATAVTVTP